MGLFLPQKRMRWFRNNSMANDVTVMEMWIAIIVLFVHIMQKLDVHGRSQRHSFLQTS